MAIHDYIIENDVGANFRADINNALGAIVSQNSSATEPTTTYAYMPWADTATDTMKVRDAANTAWVSMYTLSTGVPLAGGGGGAHMTIDDQVLSGFDYTGTPSIQVAANPIAAEGVVYAVGDVLLTSDAFSNNTTIYYNISIAIKPFTFREVLGVNGHAETGDMYIIRSDADDRLKSKSVGAPATITSVSITVLNDIIKFNSYTIDVETSGPIAAGSPVHAYNTAHFTTVPWLWYAKRAAGDILYATEAYGFKGLAPARYNSYLNINYSYDKVNQTWENCEGIAWGCMPGTYEIEEDTAIIIRNGASVAAEVILPLFVTPPIAEDPVYFIATTYPNYLGTGETLLDTSPVDGNTIRIGTWKAGNILEVQIA